MSRERILNLFFLTLFVVLMLVTFLPASLYKEWFFTVATLLLALAVFLYFFMSRNVLPLFIFYIGFFSYIIGKSSGDYFSIAWEDIVGNVGLLLIIALNGLALYGVYATRKS